MKKLRYILLLVASALAFCGALTSCIEDGISTSASDQPVFSTDTLDLGTIFTLDPSPTSKFVVYNRHGKGMNLQSVRFTDNPENIFRLNVDGMAGTDFQNVEIRANDFIYVFVEATLPENGRNVPVDCFGHIEFTVNGVTSTVAVKATGRDVVRLRGDYRITADTEFSADKPYQVLDSIVVEQGATLTIPAGTEMVFHDKANIAVYGTLRISGTADRPVDLNGDRTGFVAADIPYEIMSGQWGGIYFAPSSKGNVIEHATVRNTEYGVLVDNVPFTDSEPSLKIANSVIRNSKGFNLQASNSSVLAINCEIAEASEGLVYLYGGKSVFNHCTLANYYLFSAAGPDIVLEHTGIDSQYDENTETPYLEADFTNSIIVGNGAQMAVFTATANGSLTSTADVTGVNVRFRNCLFEPKGEDDDNFITCIWEADPMFYTVREDYLFDYRLKPESQAIAVADTSLDYPESMSTDLLGTPRPNPSAVGAYEAYSADAPDE